MKSLRIIACTLLLAVMLLFMASACASSFQDDYDAIERTVKSVLMLGLLDENEEFVGNGSGFVAFSSNMLVTNYHVIDGVAEIWAVSDNGEDFYPITRVIAANEKKDIAILEFYTHDDMSVLAPLKLSYGGRLRRGEPVVVIGSPQFITNEVTKGNISALYDDDGVPIIQFTAPVSPGSSGGPLFNDRGEVIGITRSYHTKNQNTNHAIDIGEVIQLYKTREGAGIIRYPWEDYSDQATTATQRPTAKPTPTPVPTSTPTPSPSPKPTPSPTPKPPTVTGLEISFSSNNITLTWDTIPLADEYCVYISNDGNSFHSVTSLTNQYRLDNVELGKTYYFKVSFMFMAKESKPSAIAKVYISGPTPTPKPPLAAPSNVKGTSSAEGITITWDTVPNAKMYLVYRYTPFGGLLMLERTTLTQYVDINAKEPGVYSYKVISTDGTALSADPIDNLKVNSFYTISGEMAVPLNFKAKVSSTAITLTWSKVKNATEYAIYRATSVNGIYSKLAAVTAVKYTDKNVVRGNTYFYKIRSIDSNKLSENSQPIKAVMPKPTPTPKPTKTPKPTPTPYKEPANPIMFLDSYVERYQGDPYINLGIKNTSKKKTIDGFTIVFYCEDVYGEKIKYNGNGEINSTYIYTKTIKPGKSIMAGYVQVEGFDNAKYVYVAVAKFHTTDGNTVTIPESNWEFYYYTLD